MDSGKPTQSAIRQAVQAAVHHAGSYSVGAALQAMCRLYDISPDDGILHAAMGIDMPGTAAHIHNAYLGVCLFLTAAAQKWALSPDTPIQMCNSWKSHFAAIAQPYAAVSLLEDFVFVLENACVFLETNWEALQLQTTSPKPKQYYEQILTDRDAMFQHSPYALEETLTKAVTRGDRPAAVAALHEITRQGDKAVVAKDPLRSAKNSMIGSIAFLARAAIQAGVNADKAFALSDSLIQYIEDMTAPGAVLAFEEKILLQFIDLVNARLETAYSVSVTRVMHYIENNLNKKISLSDAAGYAGVHPAYLSARFKKETGLSFSHFVTLRKIQESTYFVRHTHYSVSQIALLYGFSSQSYYITSFKRVMDMTPMEYRSRYLSD